MKNLKKTAQFLAQILVVVIGAKGMFYLIDNYPKVVMYLLLGLLLFTLVLILILYTDIKKDEDEISLEEDEHAFRAEEIFILFDSEDYDSFLEKCIAPLWGKDFIVVDKDGYQLSTDYCDESLYPITVYRLSHRVDESKMQ